MYLARSSGTPEPPPSAARLRYLSQRRGSIGAEAAADRAAGGGDDDGEALDSAEVQRELEGDLAWLLARRTEDPYRAPVPRVPVEASWEWKKQAPSFKVE